MELGLAEIQAALLNYMHCMDPNGPSVPVFSSQNCRISQKCESTAVGTES